jgi:uncharacterized integral membrane protein (TIGR00698 family)
MGANMRGTMAKLVPPAVWRGWPALLLIVALAWAATLAARLPQLAQAGISPLIIGVLCGILLGNSIRARFPAHWTPGIGFCGRTILRLAIVLYGFRLTLQNVAQLGLSGFAMSLFIVVSTLALGMWLGTKLLGLDRDTALLTASGSAICGAAAVLAVESLLRSDQHKAVVAVATVVLFGTFSMLLYPALYAGGLLHLTPAQYSLFIGGAVHEVAQVVAASAIAGDEATATATMMKMTRVLILVPTLLLFRAWLLRASASSGAMQATIPMPWFAIGFLLIVLFNSLALLPGTIVKQLNVGSTFLLTVAMVALGLETRIARMIAAGGKPFLMALLLALWLGSAMYILVRLFV